MAGSLEAPDGGRAPDDPRSGAPAQAERPRSGRVSELALVAAGLGLVVYLLGFVDDAGIGAVVGPLLVGGGLLAGSVALPSVSSRVLVPAAVAIVTGTLFLLQTVVGGVDSPYAIGALVLALLEAAAATGAALMQAGVVRAPRPKPAAAAPYAGGPPPQPGQAGFPGQQYPGQPYPGSYAAAPLPGAGYPPAAPSPGEQYPGDQYAGEHAYAQNARYGGQYGVPGYPPPPYGAPAHDPAGSEAGVQGTGAHPGHGASAATPMVAGPGADRPGDPPATDDPSAGATTIVQTSGVHRARPPRSEPPPSSAEGRDDPATVVQASGAHRARSAWSEPPSAPAEGRDDPATAAPGSGTFRIRSGRSQPPSGSTEGRDDPATAVQASGAHRGGPEEPRPPEPTAGAPAPADGRAPGPERTGGAHDAEAADAHTRAIPRVTDER
jgi:Family of unknown function (DUF5336)